jgi:prophage regulatory protein
MEEIFIRRKALEAKLGLSCSTIYAMMAADKFPRPIKIGRRAVGWRNTDIQEWVLSKVDAANE